VFAMINLLAIFEIDVFRFGIRVLFCATLKIARFLFFGRLNSVFSVRQNKDSARDALIVLSEGGDHEPVGEPMLVLLVLLDLPGSSQTPAGSRIRPRGENLFGSVDSVRSISVPQALACRIASTHMTGRNDSDASSPCATTTGVADPCPTCNLHAQHSWVLAEHGVAFFFLEERGATNS
jgi:hypothetical protein